MDAPAKLNENQAEEALKSRRKAEQEAWAKEIEGMPLVPALSPTRQNFDLAEQYRMVFRANVPAGVGLDRVLDTDYFKHVAGQLKPGYLIEVLPVDFAWFATLLVRKVGKEEVRCSLLSSADLNEQAAQAAAPEASDYAVKFAGAHKWRIVRLADNEVIHHGEPTEADAKAWLADFLKG